VHRNRPAIVGLLQAGRQMSRHPSFYRGRLTNNAEDWPPMDGRNSSERTVGFQERRTVCEFTRMYLYQPRSQGKLTESRQTRTMRNSQWIREMES
jgi:hypothetical protein